MFFKKSENNNENEGLIKVAALLIHAAKIDENYSEHEEEIIKKTLVGLGANKENTKKIIEDGKKLRQIQIKF